MPAFKDALAEFPMLHLTVGGNGEVEKARALAEELGIERRVAFAGWVSGETKAGLLGRSASLFCPPIMKGFQSVCLEAMSWQIPVVSTRVGDTDLVRNGVDGFLIEAGDRTALSSAIVDLAKDAGLREQMGMEGRSRVQREFSKAAVLPKLEDVYRFFLPHNLDHE